MTIKPFSKLTWLKQTAGHKLSGPEWAVLVALFNHTGRDGREAYVSVPTLMKETGYGETAVKAARQALTRAGWIHQTKRGNGLQRTPSWFDLVPDAPNSGHRCPPERARSCSTCSANTDTHPSVLETQRGRADDPNGDALRTPIRTPIHLLTDPTTDPTIDPVRDLRSGVSESESALTADEDEGTMADAAVRPLESPSRSSGFAPVSGSPADSGDTTDPFSCAFVPPTQRTA